MLEISLHRDGKLLLRRPAGTQTITIGRDGGNTICLMEPEVSRRHCEITPSGNKLLVKDTSSNGTLLNGKPVTEAKIKEGDHITIGPWTLSVEDVKDTPTPVTIVADLKTRQSLLPKVARLGALIGPSKSMREVFALMERIAPTDTTVCITGESGTGKELVAQELHNLSPRRRCPFVAINCGAVPESIIEGQLFGHERGAFTGAVERVAGLFEQAKGGTIFLDEIGEMPIDLQTRLLRVLESKTVRRIGGQEEIPIDVRIVCATNKDIKRLVTAGKFREDLFFRIFVVPITIAPLKERPEDIPALAEHFAARFSDGANPKTLTQDAFDALVKGPWPGNVRELKNTIERTLILADHNTITAQDLKFETISNVGGADGGWQTRERDIFATMIAECGYNLSKAAKRLGVSRTTIQAKIKRYSIPIPHRGR